MSKADDAQNKKAFMLYYDDLTGTLPYLTMEERGQLFTAIYEREVLRQEPNTNSYSPVVCMSFDRINASLERLMQKYLQESKARSKAGKKGGEASGKSRREKAQKKSESKQVLRSRNSLEFQRFQGVELEGNEANEADTDTVTDTVTDTGTDKVKVTESERDKELPTLEQVKAYCFNKGLIIDPERFYNYYEARGWQVGNTPIKDWQALALNWNKSEKLKKKSFVEVGEELERELRSGTFAFWEEPAHGIDAIEVDYNLQEANPK